MVDMDDSTLALLTALVNLLREWLRRKRRS
jgi:hypothetical protein